MPGGSYFSHLGCFSGCRTGQFLPSPWYLLPEYSFVHLLMYRCAIRNIRSIRHNSINANCYVTSDSEALANLRIGANDRVCVNQVVITNRTIMVNLHTRIKQYAISDCRSVLDPFCTTTLFKTTHPQPSFAYGLI